MTSRSLSVAFSISTEIVKKKLVKKKSTAKL